MERFAREFNGLARLPFYHYNTGAEKNIKKKEILSLLEPIIGAATTHSTEYSVRRQDFSVVRKILFLTPRKCREADLKFDLGKKNAIDDLARPDHLLPAVERTCA